MPLVAIPRRSVGLDATNPLRLRLYRMVREMQDREVGRYLAGGTCDIVITDTNDPAITFTVPVTFAASAVNVSKTMRVLAGSVNRVTAKTFPVGDTVKAMECDSTANPATNLATNCDAVTAISGSPGTSGTVAFNATGVTIIDGSSYTEAGSGSVVSGDGATIVVIDSSNAALSTMIPITLAP